MGLPGADIGLNLYSVVVSAHHDLNRVIVNRIDQAMLSCNPAGPETTQIVFERLRLTGSVERLTLNRFDQQVDPFEPGLIVLLEPQIVVPTFRSGLDIHSSMSCLALVFPARRLLIDLIKRSALAGERSKYAVSSSALYSAKDINTTGSPFCRVTNNGARSSLTRSMVSARCARAVV